MRAYLGILFCLLLNISPVYGGVNLKNGNFYISYTDIIVPGPADRRLEITRTCNSKSLGKGYFGICWGSRFETNLTVSPDTSVVIHENGSGALTRFTPKESVDPTKATKKIITAMRKKMPIDEKFEQELTNKLVNNAILRQTYAKKYEVKTEVDVGTVLYSNVRGLQKVVREKNGYKRIKNDGETDFFNDDGKIVKIQDKNGYVIDIEYKNDLISSIKDSDARQLSFSWIDKKVQSIWSAGDKKTFYKYQGDDLIYSKDIGDNEYKYEYDTNHNLTKITYIEKNKNPENKKKKESTFLVEYDKSTHFVTKIKDRDGKVTRYEYGADPSNPKFHYWTTVITRDEERKKDIKNRYEYEIKARPDGSQYTYKIKTDLDGLVTETIYSECCSLPLKITQGKHVTTFDYNDRGLLKKKTSSKGEFVELEYHEKFNKITRVVNNDGWTNFSYDKKGNLAKAINNKGQSILLVYDLDGRIKKMVDFQKTTRDKRSLTFKYNSMGKPIEIAMSNVGKINVAYDNYGEIKKVESKAGHKMALQVTQAFQSLLSIVKPAGVDLNM